MPNWSRATSLPVCLFSTMTEGAFGVGHLVVRPVNAVRRADVQQVAADEDRAVRAVVRSDAQLGRHVEPPERTRLAAHVQAQHLAAIADQVGAIAFDRRRRSQSDIVPVGPLDFLQLGHDQLPEKLAGLLVEAHQHAAVALDVRVAGGLVVRAHQHPAAGHDRRTVGLVSQPGHPFHVAARRQIDLAGLLVSRTGVEAFGQPLLVGDHVPRVALAPLRLVGGRRDGAAHAQTVRPRAIASKTAAATPTSNFGPHKITTTLLVSLRRMMGWQLHYHVMIPRQDRGDSTTAAHHWRLLSLFEQPYPYPPGSPAYT